MSLYERLHGRPGLASHPPVLQKEPAAPRAAQPVVSPWVKGALTNPSGRSLQGGLPAKEIK